MEHKGFSCPFAKTRLARGAKRYLKSEKRQERTAAFVGNALRDPLQALLIRKNREPFAALHAFADVTL